MSSEHASNQHISSLEKIKQPVWNFTFCGTVKTASNCSYQVTALGFPISLKANHGVWTLFKSSSHFLRATPSFEYLPMWILCYLRCNNTAQSQASHNIHQFRCCCTTAKHLLPFLKSAASWKRRGLVIVTINNLKIISKNYYIQNRILLRNLTKKKIFKKYYCEIFSCSFPAVWVKQRNRAHS